jgi:hypothetical protein
MRLRGDALQGVEIFAALQTDANLSIGFDRIKSAIDEDRLCEIDKSVESGFAVGISPGTEERDRDGGSYGDVHVRSLRPAPLA